MMRVLALFYVSTGGVGKIVNVVCLILNIKRLPFWLDWLWLID